MSLKPTLLIVDDEKPTREGLRAALEEQLGDLDPSTSKPKPKPASAPSAAPPAGLPPPSAPAAPTPSVKKADIDFDDAE